MGYVSCSAGAANHVMAMNYFFPQNVDESQGSNCIQDDADIGKNYQIPGHWCMPWILDYVTCIGKDLLSVTGHTDIFIESCNSMINFEKTTKQNWN